MYCLLSFDNAYAHVTHTPSKCKTFASPYEGPSLTFFDHFLVHVKVQLNLWSTAEVCTIYSSPSLPMGVLGPTLDSWLLTKDNVEILAIIYTNLPMKHVFTGTLYQDHFSCQWKNVGSKSRLKQWSECIGSWNKILDVGAGFKWSLNWWLNDITKGLDFFSFFLLCHPLGQLPIVFGSKMQASRSQDCMLSQSYPARKRDCFSKNS